MSVFLAILIPVAIFCVGLIIGTLLGFKRGYTFHQEDRFWECNCQTADRCIFYGPKDLAETAVKECRKPGEKTLYEVEWVFPLNIQDLTSEDKKR